ncbi:DNA-directed primase/polymerase protein [Ditylenchus destructor]|uniref:DNA-directed primase/polymerase protein n=1 Tax=Ditylenchus destructor TaxID=166010 RepID=A0AAD4MQP4_9BILA|nr:DNA-directed primase/polymerase protein [Ditylenchus destructor]
MRQVQVTWREFKRDFDSDVGQKLGVKTFNLMWRQMSVQMRACSSAAVKRTPMFPETARDSGKSTTDVEFLLRKQFTVDFRQIDAIARTTGQPDMRVWAFEAPKFKPACRKFVAAHHRSFYLWYRECDESLRHFYEIIQEGRPCRLYFDLEYKKEHNPKVNPERMLHQFIDVCVRVIHDMMDFELDRDKSFLTLDSSSDSKFSVHIIVHFPEQRLFQSCVALKPLVNRICAQMLKDNVGVIKDEDGSSKLLCDRSVYSRNRNFRLFLSSKCGTSPNPILKLAKSCRFYQDSIPPSNAQIFLDSLVIPVFYDRFDIMEIPGSSSDDQESQPVQQPLTRTYRPDIISSNTAPVQKENIIVLSSGPASSPFPALDEFMLGVFRKLNREAGIRMWQTFLWKNLEKERWERIIQYQLSNCRFCHNKGREHRRQNVYWKVNLDFGFYVQRCFDVVDCPGFETKPVHLPAKIVQAISTEIDAIFPDSHRSTQTRSQEDPLHRNSKRPAANADFLFANIFPEEGGRKDRN